MSIVFHQLNGSARPMPRPDSRPALMLVEDDQALSAVLARALEQKGFSVSVAHDSGMAVSLAAAVCPQYAVVDLSLPGGSGLGVIRKLHERDPRTRIVVVTGCASISTAVEAVKLGACHYLTKPCNAESVVAALRSDGDAQAASSTRLVSVKRLAWEHIQRALSLNGGNISATARQLGMHRRTLQRKLGKATVNG